MCVCIYIYICIAAATGGIRTRPLEDCTQRPLPRTAPCQFSPAQILYTYVYIYIYIEIHIYIYIYMYRYSSYSIV